MERFKRLLKKIFFLPPLPTLLIALPSLTFVFCVLSMGIDGAPAYISYGLSAYAVVISATGFTRVVQFLRGGIDRHPIVKKVLAHPLGGRYLTDAAFRTEVSLYPSLCISLIYAAMKMFSGILFSSVWFVSLAAYYILLAVMRFLLLTCTGKKRPQAGLAAQYRRCRACGVLLALMTLALSGMVLFLVRQEGTYSYPGMLIYIMAIYAFYAVITVVTNLIKFRRHASPVLSAAKAINLTAALVSMLALETAMLTQFGSDDDHLFRRAMTASSGGVVCALVLAMAAYMVFNAARQLRKLSNGSPTAL